MTIVGLPQIPDAPEYKKADVNHDDKVNATDVVSIYNYIINGEQSGISTAQADVNGDDKVNATDVVSVYNYIINGDAAGAPAFVAPGTVVGDEIIEGSDNVVYALVENTDNLAKIPVTIYLTNPTTDITSVEAAIKAPVEVGKFLYDEDEEDFVYESSARWKKTHGATLSAGTEEHGADAFFVSIASTKTQNFLEKEGAIITVYFDGSGLADGEYELEVFDAISVWSDTFSSNTYPTATAKVPFKIEGGKATGVESITAEAIAAAKAVYTLAGEAVAEPVKGNIYVVDGKVVKY